MSCFLFPKGLCEKIERAGKREIHWCQWKFLCRPKEEGGLGFRSMAQFNISLLAKQETLVTQVFKANFDNLQSDKVAALINNNNREWNRELIVNTFPAKVADLIF
ncbi:reverse transcriptase-like protein [Gossypium australe]|uniref:Reverse transcriptase-like protein n=1 Tax=Gossypium australe TaxID=47621 RepID=A0A5B6VKV7_9ROSI|nr:reverse transcriptase-like protein [Gossypium australe]